MDRHVNQQAVRRAVAVVNQTLADLKVEQHPDKTFIGRIDRGFCFLGYDINKAGLIGVAPPTSERFVERISRLYEQGAGAVRIGAYVRRWLVWVLSGLEGRFNWADFMRSVLNGIDDQLGIMHLGRPR